MGSGTFIFQALTLEVNNPDQVFVYNNNQSNMGFVQQQTLLRGGWNYRTCDAIQESFQKYSGINYPYPCPQSSNPAYLTMSNPDWMGRQPKDISIDPILPFPNGTSIYYYKVKELNTGKIFEYQK